MANRLNTLKYYHHYLNWFNYSSIMAVPKSDKSFMGVGDAVSIKRKAAEEHF